MQIPNEWLNGGLGALIALVAAKWLGWLSIPFLEGNSHPPSRQPIFHQAAPGVQPQFPTYETTVTIPHKISVTPQ